MAEAQAHASLGYIFELLNDTDRAIDHYEQVSYMYIEGEVAGVVTAVSLPQRLRIALDVVDKGAEARSYCSIGNCLRAMVQPDKALQCYKRVRV